MACENPENIEALAALTPDYMGFIFWAPSSRVCRNNTPNFPQQLKKTGVFVDATVDYIQIPCHDTQLTSCAITRKRNTQYCALYKTLV